MVLIAYEMKSVYTASKIRLCVGAIVLADEMKLVYTASKIKLCTGAIGLESRHRVML